MRIHNLASLLLKQYNMFITQDLPNNTPYECSSKKIHVSTLPDYVKFFTTLPNDFPQIGRSINCLDHMGLCRLETKSFYF